MSVEWGLRSPWSRANKTPTSASSSSAQANPLSTSSAQQSPVDQSTGRRWHPLPPQRTAIPVPAEHDHPRRVLHELFLYSPHSRLGVFDNTAHATVVRQLFFSIWHNPEWLPLFQLDQDEEGGKMPNSKLINDWLRVDANSLTKSWRLSDYQRAHRKEPVMIPGRPCGKVIRRFERTYSCK